MLSVEKTEMSLGLKMTFSAAQTEEIRVSRTKHINGAAPAATHPPTPHPHPPPPPPLLSPPAELRLTRTRSSAEPSLSPMAAMTSLTEAATDTRMVE